MTIEREHIGAGFTRTTCRSSALVMALLWSGGCVDQSAEPVADPANALSAPGSVACVTLQRGAAGAVDDATIKSNALRQNFGSKPSLRVSAKDEALIRFDLGAIPKAAAIRSAKLKLFVSDNSDGGGTIQVHGVLAPWVESVVTFASFKQQFEGQAAAAFRAGNKKTFKSVDLAELVRSWVAGTRPNYGVLLDPGPDHQADCDRDEDEDRNSTILVSSDAPNRSERPALEVCYSLPADHCAPNPCLNGGTCSNTQNGFSCQCAPGFTGADCAMNVDDCSPNPCRNGGSCTDGVTGYSCTCPSGFSGATCEVNVNDCSPNPCQNGGVCSDAVAGYSCECAPGYDGVNCEHLIDNCADSPCHNGGMCTSGANGYSCGCAPGYSGATCDTNIDDCVAGACQNGGTCIDDINGFHCSCAPDFGGSRCEVNLNSCGQAPCLNGATCTNVAGGYTCQCAAGFEGPNCEVDIDDCAPNACLNLGLCIDGVNSHTCSCRSGFTGPKCEINIDDCAAAPCGPNGTCVDDVNSFSCQCAPGWGGPLCDISLPVTRTSWQMHDGTGIDASLNLVPVFCFRPGMLEFHVCEYEDAVIPSVSDAGWRAAPDGSTIDYHLNPSRVCSAPMSQTCRQWADFTYFQTFVEIPVGVAVAQFSVSATLVDEGAMVTVFNANAPTGIVAGYLNRVVLTPDGEPHTVELADVLTEGENRIVVTQLDDCCLHSVLEGITLKVNGQVIGP